MGVELIKTGMASSRDGRDLINPSHYAMPAGLESEFKRLLEFFGVAFPDASSKVIILSSSHKGSGVSTLSWWLAATLSRIPGKTILFVDAGSNNEIAKNESGVKGLNEILFGQASLDEALVDLGKHAPYIIRSGAEEYFGEVKDSHVENIITSFRNRYSYTIIDGLPPSESPLILNMAKYADGVFLVIESGKTDKHSCRDAVDRFRQAGARVLGALLNQIEMPSRQH
ncbi:capsular exopolysaccharide family [Methylocaldum marinum]|uniref:Capsular exopolysaccharide family n=1 Tax=Methylocaldum marinum TaxID=1432792 RepID=A0A250KP53_9GAMM|nr:capsular exopolysaccharide family [Methylocaldum marinum]